jgi:hypothetical protein
VCKKEKKQSCSNFTPLNHFFSLRVRLDVDIGDIRIELDPIPNMSSVENGLQYKFVAWIYLEL